MFLAYSGGGAVGFDGFVGRSGQCPFNSVCDFESGLCDWTPTASGTSTNRYNFALTQGTSSSSGTFDHTTETQYGHFIEAINGQFYRHLIQNL